jgi:hypothetical protein
VTGDGDVRRKLYTDGELATFAFRRTIAVTGIDLGALNGDLAERLLSVTLDQINEDDRLDEEELWPRWAEVHPKLLGALLDLTVKVLATLDTIRLARRPRMADYARRLHAVDLILGTSGLDRYAGSQTRMARESLTGDAFITAVREKFDGATFTGTSAVLLHLVSPDEGRPPKGWPTTARTVTQRLTRQAPTMRKAGWQVTDDGGENKLNTVQWTIKPPPTTQEIGRDRASPDSLTRQTGDHGELASHASKDPDLSPETCDECAHLRREYGDGWRCHAHQPETAF